MAERTEEDPTWGEALAILRMVRGWTQGRLGDAVDIVHSTVSTYELGTRIAPMALLRQMVAAMGLPAYLLDRAHSLLLWARAARQLRREPGDGSATALAELMAARAGCAREELTRMALTAQLVDAEEAGDAATLSGVESAAVPVEAAAPAMGHAAGRATRRARRPDPALAQALRVLRLIAALERDELAAATGVTSGVIASYERARTAVPAVMLKRLLDAMDLPAEVFDRTVRFLEAARAALRWHQRAGAAASRRARIESAAVVEARKAEDETAAWLRRLKTAAAFDNSRHRAPALWARLKRYSHRARRALVREEAEFQDAGLCELLCEESLRAAGDSAVKALRLASLAVAAAERVRGAEGFCRRLEGYARCHVVNALRVPGKLLAAKQALVRALELWQTGAAEDPGLLNEARVLAMEASLWRDCGDIPRALALFDRALVADQWGETSSLLVAKSKALEELGDFAASNALLHQAAALIDGEREPRKLLAVHFNQTTNLCHLGRHAQAELDLPVVRALASRLGNQLDDLRVGWLEARVAVGLRRTREAVAGFERVRVGFAQLQSAYDAALVTLELAEVHASLGRTADVKALARVAAPVFQHQGVHREARRALDIFQRAAEEERATVALIRGILTYLLHARRRRGLRYQEPA
jgi:transcriptional regulator with XRE-family HTH domain